MPLAEAPQERGRRATWSCLILDGHPQQDRRFAGCDPYSGAVLLGSGRALYPKLVASMPTVKKRNAALHTVYAVEKRCLAILLTIGYTSIAVLGVLVGTY